MSFMTPTLLVLSILSSTIAQALIKYGADRVLVIGPPSKGIWTQWPQMLLDPFILGGLTLLLLAAPMWIVVLSRLPLSVAYPMVSLGYVISLLLGVLIFKEQISIFKIGGMFLIISGVIALSRS